MRRVPTPPVLHAARWFLPERNHLLLEGDFAALFEEQHRVSQRDDLREPSPEARSTFERLLQAVTLWTTSLPNDSIAAWSVLLPEKEWRFFVAASAAEERVVGRWSPSEAEHRGRDAIFDCQMQRQGRPPHRSVFEPSARTVGALVREFLQRSQQSDGRLFWDEGSGRAQLLLHLADRDLEWFARLEKIPDGQLVDDAEFGEKRPILAPQPWRYECGCDPARLRKAILAASGERLDAVFGDAQSVEVECPRCGRAHVLERNLGGR